MKEQEATAPARRDDDWIKRFIAENALLTRAELDRAATRLAKEARKAARRARSAPHTKKARFRKAFHDHGYLATVVNAVSFALETRAAIMDPKEEREREFQVRDLPFAEVRGAIHEADDAWRMRGQI